MQVKIKGLCIGKEYLIVNQHETFSTTYFNFTSGKTIKLCTIDDQGLMITKESISKRNFKQYLRWATKENLINILEVK